jgi:hydroxyacylglutathione hydrolase
VRDAAEYARAHLIGSLNIGLNGSYATWAGTILDKDKPIVIVAEPAKEAEAAMRLGRIGFDSLVGYLNGSIAALEARKDLLTGTDRRSPGEVQELLASSSPPLVLDIRNPKEVAQRRLEGSVNIPLNHLRDRLDELPKDRPILVHCAGGYRSSIAAGLLQQRGFEVIELAGGLAAWDAAGLALAG